MRIAATRACLVWLVLLAAPARAQEPFPSPDAAARALVAATRGSDTARLLAILGPGSEEVVSSGDPVADAAGRERVARAAALRMRTESVADGATAILRIGADDWPFPIPLVRDGDGWHFDVAAGKEELLNRRIGRNELTAIAVARAYVDAQLEYAARQRTYARKFRSTSGQRDGLYWEDDTGRDESPLGPLVAAAATEGYRGQEGGERPATYHGYRFRILEAQGSHAPGGARSYVQDGRLTGGFALVAWPADHGASGVMTFVVNQLDVVFQKDLGERTDEIASAMTAYDPDESWSPAR